MPYKAFNKLVRDRIPEIIRAKGGEPRTRMLDAAAYRSALKEKMVEEAQEVRLAESVEDMRGELADALEVICSIAKTYGLGMADIEASRMQKQQERGGFEGRIFLEGVDEPLRTA